MNMVPRPMKLSDYEAELSFRARKWANQDRRTAYLFHMMKRHRHCYHK